MRRRTSRAEGYIVASACCALLACGGGREQSVQATRIAGGQTSDFGSSDGSECVVLSVEPLGVEEARARGHAVDAHLALLPSHDEATFHRGGFECGTEPSVSGTITIDTALAAIVEEHRAPHPELPIPVSCPDLVRYEVDVRLATDEGSLEANVRADVYVLDVGLFGLGTQDARDASGSLGVSVDLSRPHEATVTASLELTPEGVRGLAFTSVAYLDGEYRAREDGDGLFWPASRSDASCTWLGSSTPVSSELISLDAYRARP